MKKKKLAAHILVIIIQYFAMLRHDNTIHVNVINVYAMSVYS